MKTLLLFLFCLPFCLFGQTPKWMVYSEDFDSYAPDSGYIDSANSWYVGHPDKLVFDSAYSGSNAIFTDSSFYRTNDSSSFILFIEPYNNCIGDISFWHKINTPLKCDGGYLEIKYNSDSVWTNIAKDTNGAFIYTSSLYSVNDTIIGNIPAFSGTSSGWVFTEVHWDWWTPMKSNFFYVDSLWLKFTFKSDSINDSLDGWIIDDLTFSDAAHCSSVEEFGISDNEIAVYPNPANSNIIIDNKNELDLETVELINSVGQLILSENWKAQRMNKIDLGNLPSGLYLLTIIDATGKKLIKKIIKH